jgi:hypothetical protein
MTSNKRKRDEVEDNLSEQVDPSVTSVVSIDDIEADSPKVNVSAQF